MINFTVGPVQSNEAVRRIGGKNVPYFRTPEFSDIMLENEVLIKRFAHAPEGSRVVFVTGSGTASMEATIMNVLTSSDRAIVVNGGSFGQRFVELCSIHEVPYDEVKMPRGKQLRQEQLDKFDGSKYTAFIVNIHETSTGVWYDLPLISAFCKKNGLLLIVDAISSFLADEFDMQEMGVDVMITGSQKALACPPGISIIVLSESAQKRVCANNPKCMYFDLKSALRDGERGQTPFTPAVGTLIQINSRLKEIEKRGGVRGEQTRIKGLAEYFRERIKNLPFEIVSESMSNAVTPLHPLNASAYDIFVELKDKYGIWVCPNGGDTKDTIFRVGHIGSLTTEDYDKLIDAFNDLYHKGKL